MDLRFAVIGLGYWGPKMVRNLEALPQTQVASVADLDASRLASFAAKQPWIRTTTQVEEVFRSDVDGVIIATPVRTHYRLAKAALMHGKHVLVEKPLTANVAEAEELVALAATQQRILMVGHTFAYSPAVNELRGLVQSGELGKIYSLQAQRLNLGWFRRDINVIWDLAAHDLSIFLYVLGKAPERITAQAQAHVQAHIEDIAYVSLEFAEGLSAHIHVSWLHPCQVCRVTVIGNAKMAVYDASNPAEMIKVYNKGADVTADPSVSYRFGTITIPHIDWMEPLRLECEDFAHSIRTRKQPRAHGGIGLEVVRLLAAAEHSLGKPMQQVVQSYSISV